MFLFKALLFDLTQLNFNVIFRPCTEIEQRICTVAQTLKCTLAFMTRVDRLIKAIRDRCNFHSSFTLDLHRDSLILLLTDLCEFILGHLCRGNCHFDLFDCQDYGMTYIRLFIICYAAQISHKLVLFTLFHACVDVVLYVFVFS